MSKNTIPICEKQLPRSRNNPLNSRDHLLRESFHGPKHHWQGRGLGDVQIKAHMPHTRLLVLLQSLQHLLSNKVLCERGRCIPPQCGCYIIGVTPSLLGQGPQMSHLLCQARWTNAVRWVPCVAKLRSPSNCSLTVSPDPDGRTRFLEGLG